MNDLDKRDFTIKCEICCSSIYFNEISDSICILQVSFQFNKPTINVY